MMIKAGEVLALRSPGAPPIAHWDSIQVSLDERAAIVRVLQRHGYGLHGDDQHLTQGPFSSQNGTM